MLKDYKQIAQKSFGFFDPTDIEGDKKKEGERAKTSSLSSARLIDIERIKPDPDQPRKYFDKEKLESLAESIREIGGIIDPLTVDYDEQDDCFKILSGERRYRAAKMVELKKLPCIVKNTNEKERLLIQLVANLQREDISALEESAGIRSLIEQFGYSQVHVAKMLNKSKSYISQILGLERLDPSVKERVQTSELSREIQIHASREKDPKKQMEILQKASDEGKTVRQIRGENKPFREQEKSVQPSKPTPAGKNTAEAESKRPPSRTWEWSPDDGSFFIMLRFANDHIPADTQQIKEALKTAYNSIPK